MVKFVQIPTELKNIYENWSSIAKAFYDKTSKYEDYFLGDVDSTDTTFDKEQLERIQATTGIKTTINRIYSVTSQAIAFLSRKQLSNRVVAINDQYKNHAITMDKMVQGVKNDSMAISAEEDTIKDTLISGIGIKNTRSRNDIYETIFPAVTEHIHSSEIILDVNCTDKTLRKMQGYFIDKEIPLEEAKKLYQGHLDLINTIYIKDGDPLVTWEMFTKTQVGTTSPNRRRPENLTYFQTVWMREFYDKVFTTCYLVEDQKIGIRKLFEENLTAIQHSLLKTAIKKEEGLYVRKTTMLGDYVIDVTIEPITNWGITARFFEWGGKPYKSKGFVHYAKPLQEAYDSIFQLLVLNGYVITNAGYKAPTRSIPPSQVENWEKNLLNPLKLKLYDPVEVGDKVLIPERDVPGQLSNFYPELLRLVTQGLYEITSFDPVLLGITSETKIETFSSLNKYETAALQRIMLQFDHIALAQQQEGQILLEYLTSELSPEVPYTFLDNKGKYNEVNLTVELIREMKTAKYRLFTIPHQAMPTQRMQVSQELLKIAQTATDGSERKIFVHHALKLQDIREVDELLEELNEVNNLKQLASQLEEGIKREKELSKQHENRALRAEYREKLYARLIRALEKIAKEEQNEVLGSQIRQLEDELKEEKAKNKA